MHAWRTGDAATDFAYSYMQTIHYVIHVWAWLPIRMRALICIWVKQGYPAIPVWAARTRMGQEILPIRVSAAHMRMGWNII